MSSRTAISPNRIGRPCNWIAPEQLSLIKLTRSEIKTIVGLIPGGAANIQEIYPLAPVQEGIFFHHLTSKEGDPYLRLSVSTFGSRVQVEKFLHAFQVVVNRHDILRTSIIWEGLSKPVQVVWRNADLPIEEIFVDRPRKDALQELQQRFNPRTVHFDVRQAPWIRLKIAHDESRKRWLLLMLFHHLAYDGVTLEIIKAEINALLLGELPLPTAIPFRDFAAMSSREADHPGHAKFFRGFLRGVIECPPPFNLAPAFGESVSVYEAQTELSPTLAGQLRNTAKRLNVTPAKICHLAWAKVLSRIFATNDVIFGTMMSARGRELFWHEGARPMMGPAMNLLPIRIKLEGSTIMSLQRVDRTLSELGLHKHCPLGVAQKCSPLGGSTPLFWSLMNYRRRPGLGSLTTRRAENVRLIEGIYGGISNYPLSLSVDEIGDKFLLTTQVTDPSQPSYVCDMMRATLGNLLKALSLNPDKAIENVEVLPNAARRKLLIHWNDTRTEGPNEVCLHSLFEEQVVKTPNRIAIVEKDFQLTYGDLNRRANQLAHYLRSVGVAPDKFVAVYGDVTISVVVSILAVLKAGGAYVPLDPTYPAERLAYMLNDCSPILALAQDKTLNDLLRTNFPGLTVLDLSSRAQVWQNETTNDPSTEDVRLTPQHLAYVMYTSGSTGSPKGVMVEHRNVCNYLVWANQAYAPIRGSTVASSLCFDSTITSLYTPLLCGGTVQLLPRGKEIDGLSRSLRDVGCGLVKITPAHWKALGQEMYSANAGSKADIFVVGGEPLSREIVALWQRIQSGVRIINEYGPTETVVGCTTYEITQDASRMKSSVPIGRPIANTKIYILDKNYQPVPIGVPGEIYIAGAGVARGYLNQPKLTSDRFVRDPFSSQAKARMYKSGDLGRWLADGNIEFLGRNDFQVKIRGYRIELGEVEAQLRQHPAIGEAVVVCKICTKDDPILVACCVPKTAGDSTASADDMQLRRYLMTRLPSYMVPTRFVFFSRLPLTSNGKVDRRLLATQDKPVTDSDEPNGREPGKRSEQLEFIMLQLAELLSNRSVSPGDNFFDLGMHSLLLVRLASRCRRRFSVNLTMSEIYQNPTPSSVADLVHMRMKLAI